HELKHGLRQLASHKPVPVRTILPNHPSHGLSPESLRNKPPAKRIRTRTNLDIDSWEPPPEFWDRLSKIELTRQALRELDRRTKISWKGSPRRSPAYVLSATSEDTPLPNNRSSSGHHELEAILAGPWRHIGTPSFDQTHLGHNQVEEVKVYRRNFDQH
ncbi:hypothetical protein BN1723_014244, partial [Verticillium longisporum]